MEDGRILPQRLQRIKHRGQFLILHLNELECFLGDIPVLRRHCGYALPDKAHAVLCQHRDIEEAAAIPYAAHIGACQDGMDARHLVRSRGINADNPGVRQRAS